MVSLGQHEKRLGTAALQDPAKLRNQVEGWVKSSLQQGNVPSGSSVEVHHFQNSSSLIKAAPEINHKVQSWCDNITNASSRSPSKYLFLKSFPVFGCSEVEAKVTCVKGCCNSGMLDSPRTNITIWFSFSGFQINTPTTNEHKLMLQEMSWQKKHTSGNWNWQMQTHTTKFCLNYFG